jgi:spermidine synthase
VIDKLIAFGGLHDAIQRHHPAKGAVVKDDLIGGGDGAMLREVSRHRSIESITMVEIDAGVVSFCRQYLAVSQQRHVGHHFVIDKLIAFGGLHDAIQRHHPAKGDFGQYFSVDNVLYHEKTDHQDLIIFDNRAFGRVMALDGVVQTTERDEFIIRS